MVAGAKIRLVSEILHSLNQGDSFDDVFDLIYNRLREFVPYNRIAIALMNEEGSRLSIVAARADGKMVLGRGYSGAIAGSSLEALLKKNRVRVLNDLEKYLDKKPASDSTRLIVKEGMRSSLTLPLLRDGRPIGVMFFSSREAGIYSRAHQRFLAMIAGHMAVAIERARLLEELRDKTEYLDNILQNSGDAIIVCDPQDRIRTWNQGARRTFGHDARDVAGRPFSLLLTPEERERWQGFRAELQRVGCLSGREIALVDRNGRCIDGSVTATVLTGRGGRPIGWSAIIRDVSELHKLQSLAAVGELAAQVAHEVKNPLAGISGAVQILKSELPPGDSRAPVMDKILGQIDRLDRTVRELLDFSRPMAVSRTRVDVRESLDRAWAMVASAGTNVRFVANGAAGVVRADPNLLHQVWLNLMMNAVEAMPAGGDIHVKVDGSRITVRDSGPGVAPDVLARIGQPFFSTKTRGTGLGLAIVRKIVEAHGGSLRFESAPGKGLTATVEIPQ